MERVIVVYLGVQFLSVLTQLTYVHMINSTVSPTSSSQYSNSQHNTSSNNSPVNSSNVEITTTAEVKLTTSSWVSYSTSTIRPHRTSSQLDDIIPTSTFSSLNDSKRLVQSTPIQPNTVSVAVNSTPGLNITALRMTSSAALSKANQTITSNSTNASFTVLTTAKTVTSAPANESFTAVTHNITSKTSHTITSAPTKESFAISNVISKTSQSVMSTTSENHTTVTSSVTSNISATNSFVTSSQAATATPKNLTVSSYISVAYVPGVTSTINAIFPVTSTLFPSKSLTSYFTVRTPSSFVTRTSSLTSIIVTSTKLPSTIPSTTTKPPSQPKIIKLQEETKVREGSTLKLECKATGNPTPIINWKKDNVSMKNNTKVVITRYGLLKIFSTTRDDYGTYQCIATNSAGKDKSDAEVKIIYFSDFHFVIDKDPVKEGSDVSLTCSSQSYPKTVFYWEKNGEKEWSSQSNNQNGSHVSVLKLNNVTRKMGGNYTCSADVDGELKNVTSKVLHVQLSDKPTYPPSKEMKKTSYTIKIPIHNIKFLSNGKTVSYTLVIVAQLEENSLPDRMPSSYKPSELGPYKTNRTWLYIAAVMKEHEDSLILGDDHEYTITKEVRSRRNTDNGHIVYRNAPLLPDTYYTAFQRMISDDQDYESLDWIPPTKTMSSQIQPADGPDNLTLIMWVLLVLLLLLIVVVIGVIIYFVKKRKSQELGIDKEEIYPGKNAFGKMARTLSIHMARLHEHYHPSGPIPIENFHNHVIRMHKSGDMHFSTEYEKIPEYDDIPATKSIDPANQWKNRYTNIVAYDFNRVKLIPFDDEPASDYINASYITGYKNEKTYIAAQGPLDETCGDFWRMILEQNTKVIVMLSNVRERGRLKCSQYWPISGTTKFECVYVSLEEVIEMTSYTVRVFRVAMAGQKETRIVKQFHYTSWPDHGVPKSVTFLLAFVRETVKSNPPDAGPMVIHCSAGVGRTGTFITIDAMLQQIAREKTVDILNFVIQLRKQRNIMVQTEQQYIFIHDAILDAIISGETEVHASRLRNHVQEMMEPSKETGETKMSLEFQRLSRGVRPHYTFTAATIPANKRKNRYANTLPLDDTRVPLVVQVAVNGSDYINANYIDSYMKKKAFIATQAPLPDTFTDFWRMIWEQESYTVVTLAQEIENTKVKMNRYWPTTHPITFDNFQVEILEEEKKEFMEIRVFNVTNTKDNTSRIVHQFHYTVWTSEDLSDSGTNLLGMIDQIQQWQEASGHHVMTVHCSAGVGRTGVFCAVSSLIERLKAEAVVDVFQTVKQLREQRPAMVQTKSQYEFCYIVLLEYLNTHNSLEETECPDLLQPNNTGNPAPNNEQDTSEHNSPENTDKNRKSHNVKDSLTPNSLYEAKPKDSSNHVTPGGTVTSENVKTEDMPLQNVPLDNVPLEDSTVENVTLADVTHQNVTLEESTAKNVTLEDSTVKNVTLEDSTVENVTLADVTTEKNTAENVTLADVTEKSTAENVTLADVTPQNVTLEESTAENDTLAEVTSQNVTLEVNKEKNVTSEELPSKLENSPKADEEALDNIVDNSPLILQRADSEESDPYVSPLSSYLNLNT